MSEFGHEPHGLPGVLPAGERILWQGGTRWRSLAWRAYKVRFVTLYFGLVVVWRAVSAWPGGGFKAAADATLPLIIMGVLASAALALLAWLTARSAVYTITNRRLMIRSGIALPITVNVPFSQIHSAAVKLRTDGSGDLPVEIQPGTRVSYVVLWPHVRPWSFARPQPMLREIAAPADVASILSAALAEAAGSASQGTAATVQPVAAATTAPGAVVDSARAAGSGNPLATTHA